MSEFQGLKIECSGGGQQTELFSVCYGICSVCGGTVPIASDGRAIRHALVELEEPEAL